MQLLYDTVCGRVSCYSSTDHRHRNNHASVDTKVKRWKTDCFDELTADLMLNGTDLLLKQVSTLLSLVLSHCIAFLHVNYDSDTQAKWFYR